MKVLFFTILNYQITLTSNFLMDEPAGLLEFSESFYIVQNLVSRLYESNILPDLLQNTKAFVNVHIQHTDQCLL